MTLREKVLYHQVHPAKIATDIGAAGVSLYFLWQHELLLGLLTHYVPPPIGSMLVIGFANLQRYERSRLGSYLRRYMTPGAQILRLVGDTITVFAAWLHSPAAIGAGVMLVVAAWTYGLLLRRTA